MKNTKTAALFFILAELTLSQAVWSQRSSIDSMRFNLVSGDGNFLLLITANEYQKKISIPWAWLVPSKDLEGTYVFSTTNYDTTVTSFKIGDGQIGLHLSSYEIQQEGSLQAAAGRDVFLIYDPGNQTIHPGIVDLGITKNRFRSEGLFAINTKFLISDINHDGSIDIGIIKEEFESVYSSFYRLHPIQWYVFQKNRWRYDGRYDGKHAAMNYMELPLIGMVKSPVDFFREMCLMGNILLMEYSDFGLQSMAYELIGFRCYQWNSHGDSHPGTKYDIKVVIYKDINPVKVHALYPVNMQLRQDYRYVEYSKALEYLDKHMKQLGGFPESHSDTANVDLYKDLMSTLRNTREEIVAQLGR